MRLASPKIYKKAQFRLDDWSPEPATESPAIQTFGLYDFNNSGMTFAIANQSSDPMRLEFDLRTQANRYFCSVIVVEDSGNVVFEKSGFKKNESHKSELGD